METEIFTNDKCNFYSNNTTKMLEKHLKEGGDFPDHHVLIAEYKDSKCRTYVLFSRDTPIYADTTAEGMAAHIDVMRILLHF